jgi:hypothetical protein
MHDFCFVQATRGPLTDDLGENLRPLHNKTNAGQHVLGKGIIMATLTEIPVTVSPDAAARVAELGMQREFQMMIDQLKQIIPGLREIEVTLEYPPDYDDDPMVLLSTVQPPPTEEVDPTCGNWRSWLIETFPPDVLRHFVRLPFYDIGRAR